MNNIEQKALELVNEVLAERRLPLYDEEDVSANLYTIEALCRSIERHEAFRQEVSDAIVFALKVYGGHSGMFDPLRRFIIAKPDPLAEALAECDGVTNFGPGYNDDARVLRAALAKRGGRIVFDD